MGRGIAGRTPLSTRVCSSWSSIPKPPFSKMPESSMVFEFKHIVEGTATQPPNDQQQLHMITSCCITARPLGRVASPVRGQAPTLPPQGNWPSGQMMLWKLCTQSPSPPLWRCPIQDAGNSARNNQCKEGPGPSPRCIPRSKRSGCPKTHTLGS